MQSQKFIALLLCWLCAAATHATLAQHKKTVVTATAVPAKTARLLTSRLTPNARAEEAKTKKNVAFAASRLPAGPRLKESARPVAVSKLAVAKPKSAMLAAHDKNAKSRQAASKALPVKALTTPNRSAAKGARATTLTNQLTDAPRKGKFGKDKRTVADTASTSQRAERRLEPNVETQRATALAPKRETKPVEFVAARRASEPVAARRASEEVPTRRPRPRVAEEDAPEARQTARDAAEERSADATNLPIAKPDRIEALEPNSPQIAQLLALPNARPTAPYGTIVTRNAAPPAARKDVSIPQQRIFEIQYELSKRGFYTAEPNGLYDDATVAAMWEFQKNYGLPATGYPTAHALKRLGLTSW